MKWSKGKSLLLLGVALVVIDQVIKVLVKTNMTLGESIPVLGNWFQLLFVENKGMAFGMAFGGVAGKYLLTLFRIVLFGFLCWWIAKLLKRGTFVQSDSSAAPDASAANGSVAAKASSASNGSVAAKTSSAASKNSSAPKTSSSAPDKAVGAPVPTGVLVGLTLITAGAFGNIVDCLCYGLIFSESTYDTVATLGSYAPFMQGKVVDMFYFPLWTWPSWVPGLGGHIFFEPVFNFADSCVTVGAIYLILFHWKFFAKE